MEREAQPPQCPSRAQPPAIPTEVPNVTKTILGTPAPLPADCSHMKHPNENNQGASQLCRAKPHNCCYCKSMRFGDAFKNAAINN